jgi:DNA-binding TFAR19-related protein (PDSD5 family)
MVEEIAKTLNIEPKEIVRTALQTGLKSYQWGKLSTADVIACVNFLAYLDALFYRRIYVESPIESVIRQADKFSEATRKILEGYGGGLRATVEKVLEEKLGKMKEERGEEERKGRQQNQGLLDKMIDNIMSYIADELGARLSKEVADAVAPELREIILKMIKEGRIRIELGGEEVVKGE